MTMTDDGPQSIDATTASGRARLRRALAPRATRRQAVIGVLFVALGFTAVSAARGTTTSGLLLTARQDEIVRVLDDLTERQTRLEIEQRALEATRDRLLSGSEEQRLAVARARADALAILAGTVPATGPGVRITIADPDGVVDYTVLLDAVQELRDAGAEAIQIADVRVVASTWFDDAPTASGSWCPGSASLRRTRSWRSGGAATLATALEIPGGVADTVRTAGGAHLGRPGGQRPGRARCSRPRPLSTLARPRARRVRDLRRKAPAMSQTPENLRYTREHEWVDVTPEGRVRFGITDHAQEALGDIVFVTLPAVGATVAAGEPCGEVESTKSVSDIYAPVSGTVVDPQRRRRDAARRRSTPTRTARGGSPRSSPPTWPPSTVCSTPTATGASSTADPGRFEPWAGAPGRSLLT